MLLTLLDTKIGSTFTGAWEQCWLYDLPAATNDSYGYQQELNPGSSPLH